MIQLQRDSDWLLQRVSTVLPTFPLDWNSTLPGETYVRGGLLPIDTKRPSYSHDFLRSLVQLQFFFVEGRTELLERVEVLRPLLEYQFCPHGSQTLAASLAFLGRDPVNSTLHRADLSLPIHLWRS